MEQKRVETSAAKPVIPEARLVEWCWTLVLLLVSVSGLAVYFFGLPGLVTMALLLLPIVFALLMLVTVGG